ncbi:MAG: (2Fe-2S)-binding protein [Meiothermus sp.]|nr:(2Fe-2S)-binding protein [Meiothermus sp.]
MNLEVNGKVLAVDSPADEMLLWVLRDELGLTGTKFGCGAGICGSCTVHLDGVATRSCVTPVSAAVGKKLTTIEGLGSGDRLHPVQQAFIEQQVPQCAWCMSGQVMTAAAFIAQSPNPSESDVEAALSANYCRCGCYTRIRTAVVRAAAIQKEQV